MAASQREPSLATPLLPTVRTPPATGRHTDIQTYTTTTTTIATIANTYPGKHRAAVTKGCQLSPLGILSDRQTCLFSSQYSREMTRLATVHSLVHFGNLTSQHCHSHTGNKYFTAECSVPAYCGCWRRICISVREQLKPCMTVNKGGECSSSVAV